MSQKRKKTTFILLMGALLAFLCNLLSRPWHIIRSPESYIWIGVVLFWMFSLRNEILDKRTKQLLYSGGTLLALLFILRILKYDYPYQRPETGRLLWYAYYIPICIIPLLSLILSLHLRRSEVRKKREILCLTIICVLLVLLMLTNDIHGMAIRVYYADGVEHSEARFFYYLVILWVFGMMLFSFINMLTECRLMRARLHWWLPASVCLFGTVLLVVYYANGGSSPRVFGITLYKLQEIILILYLGFWESCILIGLVPTLSMLREKNLIGEGIHSVISAREERLRNIFDSLFKKDEEDFRKELHTMATLGVYIKRRANLELISDENKKLSTKELSLAIRETMEYYSLTGMSVCFEETGEALVPSLLIVEAYEVFADIVEECVSAFYVKLIAGEREDEISFQMRVEADVKGSDDRLKYLREKHSDFLHFLGADIALLIEDDTLFATIDAVYQKDARKKPIFRLKTDDEEKISYGLSGLAGYFLMEREALVEKTRIHDNMGRSLLMTKRYLSNPAALERDALMREWGRSILFFDKRAGDNEPGFLMQSSKRVCIEQAKRMGIEVLFEGILPSDSYIQEIMDSAITVHITNVIRHTTGKTVLIKAEESEESYSAEFSDDGDKEISEINETGGLKNLRSRVEMADGEMKISVEGGFLMELSLPRKH